MELLTIALNTILLFALWYLIFISLREFRLDLTRQRLFKIRDELFTFASEGGISFDSKAYGMMRTILNGTIRFSHKISMIRMLATMFADQHYAKSENARKFDEEFRAALSEVPYSAKKEILKARDRMHTVIAKHMVFSSFFLTLLFLIASLFLVAKIIGKWVLFGRAKNKWSAFDAEAEAIGRNNAHAH